MLFDNVTIRLLGSDDFPSAAKQRAAAAEAHDRVDAGTRERVLLAVDD